MASVSIKLKLILYSLFLIVFSAVGLAGGVALHDWNEAERDNAERIEAAVESQQRLLEQEIAGDMAFLDRFLHRIEMLKAYRKVTALDFSLPGHVDFTQALGAQLGAEYFAYYYAVGEMETEQLRHMYSKPDGGSYLYVQRNDNLLIKKLETTEDGKTNFVDGSPSNTIFDVSYSPEEHSMAYSLVDDRLMLRAHIPYTVGAEGAQVGVTPGETLGTFVAVKPVVEDIKRLDVDYGVNFTFFTVDGELGAGTVAFSDLDVSEYADADAPVRVTNDSGEEYDAVFRPVMFDGEVVGYISAAKSRAAVMASLMNKVTTMGLITAMILAVVLLAAWVAVRRFMEPVNRTVSFAKAVAEGDLEQELAIRRTDELGVLADALRGMVSSLKEMINQAEAKTREAEEESRRAHEATEKADEARRQAEQARRDGTMLAAQRLEGIVQRVTASAGELAGLADESFKGAEVQRERSAESAGAMEEMNATVVEMARNADEAVQNANEARENAERGEDIVRRLVTSINTVNDKAATMANGINVLGERAQNIGQVMDVISDIADQTNLLALNAAIEAARAGESGRGFAVVADEVRKLAEKTMQATKEVGEAVKAIQEGTQSTIRYVEDAGKAVQESTDLASDAGESLRSIVRVVSSNAENVQAIAAAAGEQSEASNFITKGVDEVSMIANDTAESMRKSSEAITEISGLTNELQQLMNELQQE